MIDHSDLDERFMAFMLKGLEHGIASIRGNGGPLIPFVLSQAGDKKDLTHFATDRYEDGPRMAEQHLKRSSPAPDLALIAFDGYLTWEGKKYDAVVVRAFAKGPTKAAVFAQRYVPNASGNGIETVGNVALIGREPNILEQSSAAHPPKDGPRRPWWKF
ncbi:MAG: hypothetical protein JST66_03235 [Bacteroidetes bacterium]|nr:hypothetical protein [Bacteroidota bacterium]